MDWNGYGPNWQGNDKILDRNDLVIDGNCYMFYQQAFLTRNCNIGKYDKGKQLVT